MNEEKLGCAIEDYEKALEFCEKTHGSDLKRIDSLNGLMKDFDSFFYEYVYVVLASGFRAKIAARLCPLIVKCEGDMEKMTEIFRNQRKLNAISEIWKKKENWSEFRATLTTVDSLADLPFIGNITKYHLARNIGLMSCAKPDVHMVRWCCEKFGKEDEALVGKVTDAIAKRKGKKQGTVDFALWVWLSHQRGSLEAECCHGGYALR